jgi:arabinogalactan oligomer / maltooligosaccharide transport system permease protein
MSSYSMQNFRQSRRLQRRIGTVIRLALAIVLITFAVFPALWIISASLDPASRLGSQQFIPLNASLVHYRFLFTSPLHPFPTWMLNSLKISGISTVLSVMITMLSAYSFSRFRFRFRRNMLLMILLIQVFPGMLTMIALFLLLLQLGNFIPWLGLNTHGGLILIYLGGAMGINVWLMKGFFDSVPREIDESAMVDGATHWQAFWLLIFPLVRPILIVVGILTFIGTYGDFILARIMLKSTENYTVMVGLYLFTTQQFAQNWGPFAAGAIMAALPIVIIYLLLQDFIVSGLTQGSGKG